MSNSCYASSSYSHLQYLLPREVLTSTTGLNTQVVLVGTHATGRHFDSEFELNSTAESVVGQDEDTDMTGAQYNTAEEVEAEPEAQSRLCGVGNLVLCFGLAYIAWGIQPPYITNSLYVRNQILALTKEIG